MKNSHIWSNREIITSERLNALAEIEGVNKIENNANAQAINVKNFGAIGDGVTDDTRAIQKALDTFENVGGTVFIPQGTYKISDTLKVYQGTTIKGAGIGGRKGGYMLDPSEEDARPGTNIVQIAKDKDGIANANELVYNIQLFDFILTGTGSGTGNGINFDWAVDGNQNSDGRLSHLSFKRLFITDFGANGLLMRTPILTTMEQVHSQRNGGSGFKIFQSGFGNSFTNTWTAGNNIGYNLDGTAYNTFHGTAADYNNVGYEFYDCQSVTLIGVGAERQLTRALNILNSNNFNIFGFEVVGNNDIAVWIDHNSYAINVLGAADNSINDTAKEFIHAEWGAQVIVSQVMTSDQAPNNYEDWSYVTQLQNSKGYFQVSKHRGIVNGNGISDERPSGQLGLQWFDTTLGKPIWYNGTNWVDSAGKSV
ncbi:MAG: glycosyl hydrolase family 28-related protein [Leuconostoc pseudomesenteroides]|uniref:glycosyl hydrolase family 28-related protein n=1 Tax=Leuconostoc pseudomesenteroides TaxID=33968 RepID=UPI0039E7421B